MRVITYIVLMAILFLVASCTPSLHPLYTEKEVVFEPSLLGTWVGDSQESMAFQKNGNNIYTLITRNHLDDKEENYELRLLRLGSYLFFDAIPLTARVDGRVVDDWAFIRPHWMGRISIQGDSMRFALLDEDWLKHSIREKRVQIQYEELERGMLGDGTILLTASTKELQAFAVKYANDGKAFSWSSAQRRRK